MSIAQKKFQVDLDYARFNFDDNSGYLEVYYSFHQGELLPVKISEKPIVKGIIQLTIKETASEKTIIDKSWQINNNINAQDTVNRDLNGVISMQLPIGSYICHIKAEDGYDTSRFDTTTFRVDISKLPEDRFSISDIELAGSINKTDKANDSFFIKNNYEVIPNPTLVFGESVPVLFFYSEFYNLHKASQSGNLRVEYVLQNSFDKEVFRKMKTIPAINNSIVDVGAINVNKFPSGSYNLVIALADSLRNIKISSSKKLYLINPAVVDTTPVMQINDEFLASEFGAMSDEELNLAYSRSRYIATAKESEDWKRLSTESGKKQFLVNFWKSRKSPSDPEKQLTWDEYLKRVEAANQKFKGYQGQGWKSDRGRVFIMYGEPGEIERFPQQSDTKAYEIWHYYDIEGGVIFVFADLQGFGGYTLLNSTKRGELKDDNWQRQIKTY